MVNSTRPLSRSNYRSLRSYETEKETPNNHSPFRSKYLSDYSTGVSEIDDVDPDKMFCYIDSSFNDSIRTPETIKLYSPVYRSPVRSPVYTPTARPSQPSVASKKALEKLENYSEVPLHKLLERTTFFTVIYDQAGSRALQQKILSATKEDLANAYSMLKTSLLKISTNIFANYIVQKILTMAPELCEDARKELAGNFAALSKDTCGCRVVQAILSLDTRLSRAKLFSSTNDFSSSSSLEVAEGKEMRFRAIYEELKDNLVEFVVDVNGNHVIQKLIDSQDAEILADTLERLEDNFSMLVKDIYGCRVLQKLVDMSFSVIGELRKIVFRCEKEKERVFAVITRINKHNNNFFVVLSKNVKGYIRNQHSNYVMQSAIKFISRMFDMGYMLDNSRILLLEELTSCLVCSFSELATHKYASNVVETCLELIPMDYQKRITVLLESEKILKILIRDPFGNYVIQTALKKCDNEARKRLICRKLKNYITGQKNSNNHEKFILEFISKLDK